MREILARERRIEALKSDIKRFSVGMGGTYDHQRYEERIKKIKVLEAEVAERRETLEADDDEIEAKFQARLDFLRAVKSAGQLMLV